MVLWLYDIAGSYQAGFSVEIAKNEGYVGGISKITEGLAGSGNAPPLDWDKRNKDWSRRWHDDSRRLGQVWGGYHYLRKGNGAAQARYFLDEMHKITGDGVNGCLVQLDNEADADYQTTEDWSNEFFRLTHDHRYLMYTGKWWWNPRQWNGARLTPHLWHSQYVNGSGYASSLYEGTSPAFWTPGYGQWPRATILQFSSKGSAGGIVANVDVNAFTGSIADLAILTGAAPTKGLDMASLEAIQTMVRMLIENDRTHDSNGKHTPIVVGGSAVAVGNGVKETFDLFANKLNAIASKDVLTLDTEAEQRIINGVAEKVLLAITQPHTYEVKQTG